MCEPGFKSSHRELRWPRTDGSPLNWPDQNVKNPNTGAWYEKVSYGSKKMTMYREKLGAHLAENIFHIKGATNAAIDLPAGYGLFCHYQPLADGSSVIREDFYIFGSENAVKFRSFPEIQPHAEWLMDESRPLNDHSRCECKYNKTSRIAVEKKMASNANAGKRPLDEKHDANKRPRHDSKDDNMVVMERAIDWRSKRRFRKGELVFFRIETISPPAGLGLPEITHWPGLISNITEKTQHNGQEAEASLSAAWTMFGASAPDSLQSRIAVKSTWSHSIRALGMFSNLTEMHSIPTGEILPWAAGVELLGGSAGWQKIAAEGNRTLDEGVAREAKEDAPKEADMTGPELEQRWKKRWGERIKFDQMPRSWDAAVFRLSVGLSIGETIAASWSQTDKITVLPANSTLTPEDVEALTHNRKTLFQGLWLRGERVWLDDLVMLRKQRSEIPENGILFGPSPGAENRPVFLKIRVIALEVSHNMPDDSQAKPADDDTKQTWRCVFYGDLYELADGEGVEDPKKRPLNAKAPKGYHYRCLHIDDSEVMLDVFDVAGRTYPDLCDSEAAYFYPPNDTSKAGRVQAGNGIMALVGLRPYLSGHQPDMTWKEDLYVIVRDATSEMERQARRSYAAKLCIALGYPVPDFDEKKNNNQNGAAK